MGLISYCPVVMTGFIWNRTDGTYPYERMFMKEHYALYENQYQCRKGKKDIRLSAVFQWGGRCLKSLALKYDEFSVLCCILVPRVYGGVDHSCRIKNSWMVISQRPCPIMSVPKARVGFEKKKHPEYDVFT